MSRLSRAQLSDMATQKYFANVDSKNMAAVLDCFHEDVSFTIQTDNLTHYGHPGVRKMFDNLFSNFEEIWHGDFELAIDVETQTICSRFNVYLKDAQGNETRLRNCNFWYVKDGKFSRVFVFMSGENVLR
ncbi:nuclear transport factor 2 family protein [Pseudomonas benzenivorans]|uniref:Nuclear transport factor 2 family protein n=1 Tax=Pseudomonas benzenivorans TaxID=556533 RepID=A0ABY5HC72_9PSED|nr:nuclear transport factor 2 family protein [Pseudomonas benzenivorans]UTW08929.1 nuclear transport factor 2 family protein [Pseudomonas benzenivorans]